MREAALLRYGVMRSTTLSILVALALSYAASAQTTYTSGDWTYMLNASDEAIIIGYSGPGGHVTFPAIVGGYNVTELGREFYSPISIFGFNNSSVTGVSIPMGVIRIGRGAFSRCSSLGSVELPSSVEFIGDAAFEYCSSLVEFVTPDTVISIGFGAFQGCDGLTTISLGAGVASIGERALAGCGSLTVIKVSAENPNFRSLDGVLFDLRDNGLLRYPPRKFGTYSVPDGVVSIATGALEGALGLEVLTFPASLLKVDAEAFSSCPSLMHITVADENPAFVSLNGVLFDKSLQALILYPRAKSGRYSVPTGVVSIGSSAFAESPWLTEVDLPSSVTALGDYAFGYCPALRRVNWHDGITRIGAYAFSDCYALTLVTLPSSLTEIGEGAFSLCTSLTEAVIPEGVVRISDYMFRGCFSLTQIFIPASVVSVGQYAFDWCDSLQKIEVAQNNLHYSSQNGVLFDKDAFTLLAFPLGKDGDYAIPSGVSSVLQGAMVGAKKLTSIFIPASLESFGDTFYGSVDEMFYGCLGLSSIEVDPENPSYSSQDGVLFDKQGTRLIRYPPRKTGDYAIPYGVKFVGSVSSVYFYPHSSYAFEDCVELTRLFIPETVTEIGLDFAGCTSLAAFEVDSHNPAFTSENGILFDKQKTELIYPPGRPGTCFIPDTVTSVFFGQSPGRGGSSVTSIEVTADHPLWSSVDGVLFDKAGSRILHYPLGRVGDYEVPIGVTSIDALAFAHSAGLTGLTIPPTLHRLDMESFDNCTALAYVNLPDSIAELPTALFIGCSSLTTVDIPNSVKGIGPAAFAYCTSLRSLVVGSGVQTIEGDALRGSRNVDTILFRGSPPSAPSGNPLVHSDSLAIYHMPDSPGWTRTYLGKRALPFVPTAQSVSKPSPSQFQFFWSGTGSIPMTVQRKSSLDAPWVPVVTNNMSGSFTDPAAPTKAFYRAVLP